MISLNIGICSRIDEKIRKEDPAMKVHHSLSKCPLLYIHQIKKIDNEILWIRMASLGGRYDIHMRNRRDGIILGWEQPPPIRVPTPVSVTGSQIIQRL